MELWSLLALNCLSLSSEEAEKIASSHKQAAVSLTPGAGTMKTQAQQVWNITYKTLLLTIISLKIIMLVFIT